MNGGMTAGEARAIPRPGEAQLLEARFALASASGHPVGPLLRAEGERGPGDYLEGRGIQSGAMQAGAENLGPAPAKKAGSSSARGEVEGSACPLQARDSFPPRRRRTSVADRRRSGVTGSGFSTHGDPR